ncbi:MULTISPECIES: protoporphyrinogen/coproporphyrinogen oxidase [Microbacterium]|nr:MULTISPECIES: FAD-dependent oxidoreductase [Microbacterium]
MTDSASGLVGRARDARIVVIGGGLAGLVAALECAKVGIGVTLVDAAERLGGGIVAADLGGTAVDVGAEAFAPPEGAFAALLDDLGLSGDIVESAAGGVWVAGLPGGRAPLPEQSILGIPANPFADDVRRLIGWRGAWRAYLDRLRPPLTIGRARSLGDLVRTRMGDRVADRMVAPAVRARFGVDPDRLDVDAAVPGLNGALTRAGSLSGAVAELLAATPDHVARARRATLRGGLTRLTESLEERLALLEVTIQRGARVQSLARTDTGWLLTCDPAEDGAALEIAADAVIVATGQAEARRLVHPFAALPDLQASAPPREIVTLLVHAPALADAPRRVAVAATDGTVLRHATAEWPGLADAPDRGSHLLRVTSAPRADAGDDDAAIDRALDAAAALTGVPLTRSELRGAHVCREVSVTPAEVSGHAEATAAIRGAAHDAGLALTGGWLVGGDPARVAADAVAEADLVRGHALWGTPMGHITH